MARRKAEWQRVSLGDIVDVVTEYWDRNVETPERFVAGEHIDEGDLRVRRWGMTSDELVPPTFNRRFRAGDVLFHSRNLKKLACPDFAGITGEKLFILRVKDPARLLPSLLPFLLQANAFSEYVNRMWAGSTNKFLNKAPLVKYEFALPPVEKQRVIADELAALQVARNDAHAARTSGEQFLEVLTWNLCTGKNARGPRRETTEWKHARLPGVNSIPRGWSIVRLADVARLESGHTPSRSNPDYWHGGIPWISLADIQRLGKPTISETDEEIAQLGVENSSARLLPAGTVVLSRTAMIGFASVTTRPMTTSQDFANFVCSDALNPKFLFWLFMGMKEFFDYTAIGSSNVKTIYMPFFQNMQIVLPQRPVQDEIVEQLDLVRAHLDGLRVRELDHARFAAALRESRIGGAA